MSTYDIVYLFCGIFRAYTIYLMMTTFQKERVVNANVERLAYGIYYVAVAGVYLGFNVPMLNLVVNLLGLFLLGMCYKSTYIKKIFTGFVVFVIAAVVETVVMIIFEEIHYSVWKNVDFDSIVILVCAQIVTFVVAIIMRYISKSKRDVIFTWHYWVGLTIISVFTMYEIVITYSDIELKKSLLILSMVLALIVIFVVISLYEQLGRAARTEYEQRMLVIQNHMFEKQLEIMRDSNEQIRGMKHDMRNHLTLIQSYIENRQWEQAEGYIQQMIETPALGREQLRTGNAIIDSIMYFKLKTAQDSGIKTMVDINLPKDLELSSVKWVTILGNLMDNAIEAAERVLEGSYIDVHMKYFKGNIMIQIKNSYNGMIKEKDGILKTMKFSENGSHGLGIANVKRALEGMGTLQINYTENEFVATVSCIANKKPMEGKEAHGENSREDSAVVD